MNCAATSLEQVSTGSTSSHLATYSTAMIIYRAPVRLVGTGNGPMKSIAQISNVKFGFTDIIRILVLGRGWSNHWHWSHFLTNIQQV